MSLPKPYYQDGYATIYHADCRDVLVELPPASIDMVWTDPPYGHNNNNNGDLAHRREEALGLVKRGIAVAGEARPITNDGPEASELVFKMFDLVMPALVNGGCCCCCCCGGGPDPQFARWSLALDKSIGFKHAVVWDKGGLGMGWHYRRNYEMVLIGQKPGAACKWYGGNDVPNVLRITGIKPRKDDHPTPKPVELPAHFIRLHSAPGDVVLDPFMGAGTTLVAAKQLWRKSIGIEIEEKYCEMAARRLSQEVLPLFNEKPSPPPEQPALL